MRDLFILWITIQLIITGAIMVAVQNEVVRGEYDCELREVSPMIGALIPIWAFVPEPSSVKDYCQK